MAQTISDEKRAQTVAFLEKTIVPKIQKLIEEVNVFLKRKGVRVGLELTWYMDDITDEVKKDG